MDSSDDDSQDYINLGKEGLPLTRLELEKKKKQANINPVEFDIVNGHMYDRPDLFCPENENQTFLPVSIPAQYPTTDVVWQPDGKQLEDRRHARHIARTTHENVVLPKTRKQKTRPVPPPKPAAQGEVKPTGAQSSEQVNWLQQEIQTKYIHD